jgi:hypothetical protein
MLIPVSKAAKAALCSSSVHTPVLRYAQIVACCRMCPAYYIAIITIFVNLGFFQHFEIVTNIRTWIKSHRYWRLL